MTESAAETPRPELKILSSRVYRGPNVWHYEPAIQLVVDLGVLEDFPTNLIPGFTAGLLERLPGLRNHTCSRGRRGGFVERLEEGTWLGHVSEHVALQLQQAVGHDMRRGKTRGVKGVRGQYNVIFAYSDETVGLAAGELAVRLVNDLVEHDPEFDFEAELEQFIIRGERAAFGPSTQAILDEAVSRDIPYIRLNTSSLVQLGQGVHAKRIRATMTSNTSSVAVDIASNKELTLTLLSNAGLPVPRSQSVRRAEDAVRLAERIGYPVVVKPLDGNHGRGVILNLTDPDAVRAGFEIAEGESRNGWVIVETYVTGKDYRCLVIDGRIAAIAERVPAHVVGDGTATISELVERTNADPRRGVGHEKVLTKIKVDQAAVDLVAQQGFGMDDVPPQGDDDQADPDRQHVDRRHLHRPDPGGAPGEHRDRRGGGPGDRARHRRHRLHRPRHHPARPRDRWSDLRGQCRPRLPDAHPPDGRRPAVHRQAGDRHAVPARARRAGSRSWRSPAPTARPPPRG